MKIKIVSSQVDSLSPSEKNGRSIFLKRMNPLKKFRLKKTEMYYVNQAMKNIFYDFKQSKLFPSEHQLLGKS